MAIIMPCLGAHLPRGKEVMEMDDVDANVDVPVATASICMISNTKGRMG